LLAAFVRQGADLLLVWPDGTQILIKGYFALDHPPALITEGGAMLAPDLVAQLAGPLAPEPDLYKASCIALYGPGFSFDQTILKAAGKAALGVINSTQWNKDLPNAANKRFVADFKNKFGRLPSLFASQGYDTARLIASAIQAVGGDLSRKDDFREALRKADFEAVRGNFKFSANHHPIHDIYIRIVVEENGVITNKTIGKGMAMRSNAYIDQCKMK